MYYSICSVNDFNALSLKEVSGLLSSQQKEYINSLSDFRRKQSLGARVLLNNIISSHYTDISLNVLYSNENGKPYLKNTDYFISITHSVDFVGCAVADRPIGIDIQCFTGFSQNLISRVCTPNEEIYIKENGNNYFYLIWSLKESYKKAFDTSFAKTVKLSFVKDGQISAPSEDVKIEYGLADSYAWSVCTKK